MRRNRSPISCSRQLIALAAPALDGANPLPIVLAGDQALASRLGQAPFGERARSLGCHHELAPLSRSEVLAFIRHRLQAAGCTEGTPFTPDAIERLTEYANGVPGTINSLCRLAFFFAADQNERHITAYSVELAASAALLDQDTAKLSRLWSVPTNRFAPSRSGSTPDPTATDVGDTERGPESAVGRPPLRPIQSARSATGAQGPPSASIEQAPARYRALAWTAATVAAILGFGSLVPGLYDLRLRQSPVAALRLVPIADPTSVEAEHRGADSKSLSIRLGETPSPETASPSTMLDNSPAGSNSDSTPERIFTGPLVEQPEPSLAPAAGSRDRPPAATPSLENPRPTGTAPPADVVTETGATSETGAMASNDTALDSAEVDRLLSLAQAHYRADRLVAPRFDNALSTYRKVLRADPGNPAALAGIAALKSKLNEYAQAEAARGDLAGARRQLNKIRLIDAQGIAEIGRPQSTRTLGDVPNRSACGCVSADPVDWSAR